MRKLNRKGMESTPFYLIFSAFLLLLTALIVFPAYGEWQSGLTLSRAKSEAQRIASAADSVYLLGDLGSIEMVSVKLPANYTIAFEEDEVAVMQDGVKRGGYQTSGDLRYRGSNDLSGPGEYLLTVVYWPEDDDSNEEKEYLLEVCD